MCKKKRTIIYDEERRVQEIIGKYESQMVNELVEIVQKAKRGIQRELADLAAQTEHSEPKSTMR